VERLRVGTTALDRQDERQDNSSFDDLDGAHGGPLLLTTAGEMPSAARLVPRPNGSGRPAVGGCAGRARTIFAGCCRGATDQGVSTAALPPRFSRTRQEKAGQRVFGLIGGMGERET